MTTSRDWGGLRGIIDEAREDARIQAATPPVACPHDGTPLDENARGVRNCPMGDYRWPC